MVKMVKPAMLLKMTILMTTMIEVKIHTYMRIV